MLRHVSLATLVLVNPVALQLGTESDGTPLRMDGRPPAASERLARRPASVPSGQGARVRMAVDQDPSHVRPLVIPPLGEGTCLTAEAAAEPSDARRATALLTRRLIMTNAGPGRRREIAVSYDARGRARAYRESVLDGEAPGPIAQWSVTAALDTAGGVQGSWSSHVTNVAKATLESVRDSASLDAMRRTVREDASRARATRPLDAAEQAKVRQLVEWFGRRCPR